MKIIVLFTLLILAVNTCEKQPAGGTDSVAFSTDKQVYSLRDTISLQLKNTTAYDLVVGFRCGKYLEMSYQKKEGDKWSDNLLFGYMSLRCLTKMDTIRGNTDFTYGMPAELVGSAGTFRLLIPVQSLQLNKADTLLSNEFDIK